MLAERRKEGRVKEIKREGGWKEKENNVVKYTYYNNTKNDDIGSKDISKNSSIHSSN